MKNRCFTVILLLVLLVTITGNVRATSPTLPDQKALVFVEIGYPDDLRRFASTLMPMYAQVDRGLLTGSDKAGLLTLTEAGLSFQVIDNDLGSGTYYLAETRSSRSAPDFARYGQVLLETATGVILKMDASQVDAIKQAGAELRLITLTPKTLPGAQSQGVFPDVIQPDPLVQSMIDQVNSIQVRQYDRELAGELPVYVDGGWYTITSRHTNSGTPIQKTTHYMGELLAADGLEVEYHVWNNTTNPNVIGEINGLVNPEDIFIIGAHVDDVSGSPGADDNASGSVATLIAADILSKFQWGCTMRFALWTGEEQGLLGSDAYAQRSAQRGENIVGYLNLDMIAWNTTGSQPGIDLLYNSSMPPTLELAQLFADVVDAYNINLVPGLETSLGGGSDHSSFWDQGYTAILAIEDQADFNPYYHSSQDTPAHTDLEYFTNFVKASIGTYAHMSSCLIPNGIGSLDGHVSAASDEAPIEDASVIAEDSVGHSYPTVTDFAGYYTRTLLADTYTVTADAYGYIPITVSGVVVSTDTVTTQDFALQLAPTYTVSGTVTETGTGLPLLAEIEFTGSPVTTWTNPADGSYQANLPQGSYTMQVSSANHRHQERDIIMDDDQTQNFILDPLPCILLVDDDNNSPDVQPFFTTALDAMEIDYDIFNIGGSAGNGPDQEGLEGYLLVVWFSGDKYGSSAGPNGTDEANLSAYLSGGGNLFLSSQDYLYDFGLTPFGQNYLGIGSFSSDSGNALTKYGRPGDPVGDNLGPYPLSYPPNFSDYGDIVNSGFGGSVAFRSQQSGGNNLDVDKSGFNWHSVFFGTDWVPIYNNNSANGIQVFQRIIEFSGNCEEAPISGLTANNDSPTYLGDITQFTATVTTGTGVNYLWDFGDGVIGHGDYPTHQYPDLGNYAATVTATNNINSETTATLVTIVESPCAPVTQADFTWQPLIPVSGEPVTFTGSAVGSKPITYTWDFGDGNGGSGISPTHTYSQGGEYSVLITATNACGEDTAAHNVTVVPACSPVTGLDFTWQPLEPFNNELITFTATTSGTEPLDFLWDFADGITETEKSVSHAYAQAGQFNIVLSANNACSGPIQVDKDITIFQWIWEFFLPVIGKN